MTLRWHAALAYALVGTELDLAEPDRPNLATLAEALSAQGWDAGRIGEHARSVLAAELPWPHPVPESLRRGCGPAQFQAALTETRERMNLLVLETRGPSTRQNLNSDEQRLLGEAPPHHVG